MKRTIQGAVLALSLGAVAITAFAKPAFMDRYNRDPYARTELRGQCTVCHVDRGGGERNAFGDAFEDAGYKITPRLRSAFPEFFDRGPASTAEEPE